MGGSTNFDISYAFSTLTTTWEVAGVGDFNNDTTIDVLWHNSTTNETVVWAFSGKIVTSGFAISNQLTPAWSSVDSGRRNNKPAILWARNDVGAEIWELDNQLSVTTQIPTF